MFNNITVLIPTFNEEKNIKQCIESLKGFNNIIIVDSFSTDSTISIVKEMGKTFIQREYEYSASQKNWALGYVKTEWVLIVDADERISEELKQEISEKVNSSNEEVGYYIPRKNYFLGKWIEHNDWYPDFNLRLFKVEKGKYEDKKVHAHVILDGKAGYFKIPMDHYSYTSVNDYLRKFMTYTTWDANEKYKIVNKNETVNLTNYSLRMKLKYAWNFIPFRPFVRFIWMYFIKRGILDGKYGFYLSVLSSFYEFVVNMKLNEMKKSDYKQS